MAQQRRLAGAVAAHQRDASRQDAASGRAPRRIAGPSRSSCQTPRSLSAATGLRRASSRAPGRGGAQTDSAASPSGSRPRSRSEPRAPDVRRPAAGAGRASANSFAPGVCSAGARARPRRRNDAGSPSWAIRPPRSAITRSATARQRSRRCSASRIVVSHSWFRRRSSPISSSPGDRVELRGGLVEQHHRRAAGERGAERDALLLAAGELVRGAVEQRVDAERERDLLDPARHCARRCGRDSPAPAPARRAPSSSRAGSRGPGTARRRRRRAGRVRARACPGRRASRVPAKRPPWKCGTRPQAARSSVDLPWPESPASRHSSPGSISRLTSLERRAPRRPGSGR